MPAAQLPQTHEPALAAWFVVHVRQSLEASPPVIGLYDPAEHCVQDVTRL
jgi:hypothetical protein